MADNNDILLKLGEISGTLNIQTESLKVINTKLDVHNTRISDLTNDLNLFKTHTIGCSKEFAQVNDKLQRDFKALNILTKEADELKTIASYKSNTVSRFKVFLGIVATIVGLLISINQLAGIKNKVSFKATPAVYATQLDTSRADTLDPFKVR